MSKFYRVILAIAGVCLVLGVTVCIVAGVSGGWNFFRNGFHNNWSWSWGEDNDSSDRNNKYEYEDINLNFDGDITSLDITIPYGDVTIKNGSGFSIVATDVVKNSFKETKVDKNVLKIEQKYDDNSLKIAGFHFSTIYGDKHPKITITIPEDFKAEKFNLDFGAGKIDISDMKTEYTSLELGAGDFTVNNLTADEIEVNGGIGKTEMNNVTLNDLDMDAGVGEVDIQGVITGDSTISAGVGQITLDIDGNEDDYYIKLDSGIGQVRLNDSKIKSSVGDNSAENSLDIDAGVGQIDINID